MKKMTKILARLLALIMCMSVFTGCNDRNNEDTAAGTEPSATEPVGPQTAAELLALSKEAMKDLPANYHFDLDVNFNMRVVYDEDGTKVSIDMPFIIDVDADVAEKYIHGSADINGSIDYSMEFDGETESEKESVNQSHEIYVVIEEDKIVTYTKSSEDDTWYVEESDRKNMEDALASEYGAIDFNNLLNINDIFNDAEMTKDGDMYTVVVKIADLIRSEDLSNTLAEIVEAADIDMSEIEELGITVDVLQEMFGGATVTYKFDKEYRLIGFEANDMTINFAPLIEALNNAMPDDEYDMTTAMGMLADMRIEFGCDMSMTIGKFGEVSDSDVKVPDNVVEDAEYAWDDNWDDWEDDYYTDTEIQYDDNVDTSMMSNDWTDLDIMIDGVLYKFPYDYDKLIKNGWEMNLSETEYSEGYVLNKGDRMWGIDNLYSATYGTDWDDFFLTGSFGNFSNNACDITKCDLWSIQCDVMFGFEPLSNYPDVRIAKGIHMGSSYEDILAAYGEPDDVFVSDYGYKMLTYTVDGIYMELTVFDALGLSCIYLSNQ